MTSIAKFSVYLEYASYFPNRSGGAVTYLEQVSLFSPANCSTPFPMLTLTLHQGLSPTKVALSNRVRLSECGFILQLGQRHRPIQLPLPHQRPLPLSLGTQGCGPSRVHRCRPGRCFSHTIFLLPDEWYRRCQSTHPCYDCSHRAGGSWRTHSQGSSSRSAHKLPATLRKHRGWRDRLWVDECVVQVSYYTVVDLFQYSMTPFLLARHTDAPRELSSATPALSRRSMLLRRSRIPSSSSRGMGSSLCLL